MSIQNATPDHTGITQPIEQIVALLATATPEERAAILEKIDQSVSPTRQQVAATITPTIVSTPAVTPTSVTTKLSPVEPLSEQEQKALKQELLDTISSQHNTGYDAWKSTYQLPAKYLATLAKKDTVMAWAKTLPQETIQGILKYAQPRLKLLTEMPVPNLLEVLNQHPTIPNQKNSSIWWDQWKSVAAKPGEFGLTPDIEDMPQENIYQGRKNPAIIAEYKRRFEQAPLSSTMPQPAYLPSIMDELARGKVYERKYWTGFKQPQGTSSMPNASWIDDHVALDRDNPDDSDGSLRGRLWVSPERKN